MEPKRKVKIPQRMQRSVARSMSSRVIGKIKIFGPIVSGPSRQPGMRGVVNPDRIIQKIQWARARGLRGLIFEINSPGGAVVASREIAEAVRDCGIHSVAWIREVGASGAYWVASACERIVADPCSSVGSIGVIGHYLEFSDLMKKHGVRYEGFKSGEFKDMGVPFRKTTAKERGVFQEHIDELHKFFVKSVAENRGLDERRLSKVADGRVFMGEEAKRYGLVDRLGGRDEAIRQCEIAGNFKHLFVLDIEDAREEILDMLQSLIAGTGLSIGAAVSRGFKSGLQDRFSGPWAL